MVLVDTSAWIEWLIGSPTGDKLASHLPGQSDWLVPTMVQLELAKWLTRELGEDKADQVIAFTQVCQVIPLDTEIALAAAEACRGPAPVLFRSGAHVRRPSFRKPRGISSLVLNVCGAGCRSR